MTKRFNKLTRFTIELTRSLVLLMMLVGLASHATVSPMLIKTIQGDSNDGPKTIPLLQSQEYCESNPVAMTPSGYPSSDYATLLVAQLTTPNGDGSKRSRSVTNRFCQISLGRTELDFKSSVINSSSIVSSSLGRQFRLVGAKPSGTS